MLVEMQLENFKSFSSTGNIELKPLTILSGVNSAGKSSIIQSLLLLKKTLESPPTVSLNFDISNYFQQSLGNNFNDFIFGHPPIEESTLTYKLSFQYNEDKIANLASTDLFDQVNAILPSPVLHDNERLLCAELLVSFTWGPFGYQGRAKIRTSELQLFTFLKIDNKRKPLIGIEIRPYGSGEYKINPLRDSIHPSLRDLNFQQLSIDGLVNFLPNIILLESKQQMLLEKNVPSGFSRFFRLLFDLIRQDLTENIYFLGSYREPPQFIYQGSHNNANFIDPKGSNFAEILWRFRNEEVSFYHPELSDQKLKLVDMVDWILNNVIQLEQKIKIDSIGKREDVLEVLLDSGSSNLDKKSGMKKLMVPLANVGLGYNQILPIIVQGLIAPKGSLVIYEQPEIHLHENVQSCLVDFFMGLALSGRRVFVETHSSRMIDKLCFEIAKDRENQLETKANVLFVHPPKLENSGSKIEEVQIDSYGIIQNYPPNFLPDISGLYEKILQEGFRKRRDKED